MNNTYPKNFYHFSNGEEISDSKIRKWLEEVKNDLVNEVSEYSIRSSGGTMVIGVKGESDYTFFVCKNYQEYSVFNNENDIHNVKF